MTDAKTANDTRKPKSANGKFSSKSSGLGKGPETVFSDTLYLESLALSVSEQDITDLMKSFDSVEVNLSRDHPFNSIPSNYVRFLNEDQADRAYVLFNNTYLPHHKSFIHFKINDVGGLEPEPQATILQVKQLPAQIDNNYLYNLFRPFGPMALCKIVSDSDGLSKGYAFIQYFRQEDADEALEQMHCKEIGDKTIAITKYNPSKSKSSSAAQSSSTQQHVMPSATLSAPHKQTLSPTAVPYTPPPSSSISNTSMEDYTDPALVLTPTMDPCNLYIKNLDLGIKSSDLFNSFRKFGRIISARVMNNPITGQSKGFGFVSFSKADEAAKALQEMNGKQIMSKAIVVAYHEPKKVRTEKPSQQFPPANINGNGGAVSPPLSQGPVSPLGQNFLSLQTTDGQLSFGMNPDRVRSFQTPPVFVSQVAQSTENAFGAGYQHNPPIHSEPHSKEQPAVEFSPVPNDKYQMKEVKHVLYAPPPPPTISVAEIPITPAVQPMSNYNLPGARTLRKQGSVESISSVLTETSVVMQKKKMYEALLKIGENEYLEDLVDMLLTLKRKERSICLFNSDFLKEKVKLAKDALEIFGEDDPDYFPAAPVAAKAPIPTAAITVAAPPAPVVPFAVQPPASVVIVPPSTATTPVVRPSKVSKAIPIVAPPLRAAPAAQAQAAQTQYAEIEAFLKSIEDMPIHEKKQRLGDRLFPLVKATGVKGSPKVTIRLLDTIDLRELAHLMYDPAKLREKVDAASASLGN